jgi:hypothetical protein
MSLRGIEQSADKPNIIVNAVVREQIGREKRDKRKTKRWETEAS